MKPGGLDPGRLTAISDGIFAVALTLLILDVRPPDVAVSKLGSALVATAPRFGIFALSFAIVAYYWVVHHLIFAYVRVANRGLLWSNLLFLFMIVVLPFSAAVLGRYPLEAPSLIIYGSNLACCSLTLGLSWWYASSGRTSRGRSRAGSIHCATIRVVANLSNCRRRFGESSPDREPGTLRRCSSSLSTNFWPDS